MPTRRRLSMTVVLKDDTEPLKQAPSSSSALLPEGAGLRRAQPLRHSLVDGAIAFRSNRLDASTISNARSRIGSGNRCVVTATNPPNTPRVDVRVNAQIAQHRQQQVYVVAPECRARRRVSRPYGGRLFLVSAESVPSPRASPAVPVCPYPQPRTERASTDAVRSDPLRGHAWLDR